MEHDFWHDRWHRGLTPFHEGRVNPMLERHFERLQIEEDALVFVPLCGKAVDMRWIRERGRGVLGVELSSVAVRDFFREQGWESEEYQEPPFRRHEGAGVRLLCGDYFELRAEHLAGVTAAYDRAALIALPPEMRERYARRLLELLGPAVPVLLVTFEYPRGEIEGPPFSVDEAEVRAHFEPARRVHRLETREALDDAPGLAERGLTRLREHAFLLTTR